MTNFLDAARWTDRSQPEPHQVQAWEQAWEALDPAQRQAFLETFRGTTATRPPGVRERGPLSVPFYSQRDSRIAGQANRMCFSSSCAMLTSFLRPEALSGPDADDRYLRRLQDFGDTTQANAQLQTLKSFGITAKFVTTADIGDLARQLMRGVPIPCGFKHQGPHTSPSGTGHWLCVKGLSATHLIANDPFGQLDLTSGQYVSSHGNGVAYNLNQWRPRWLVEGPRSGWAIIAEP